MAEDWKFLRMKNEPQFQVEIRDVTTGLWVWRLKNPFCGSRASSGGEIHERKAAIRNKYRENLVRKRTMDGSMGASVRGLPRSAEAWDEKLASLRNRAKQKDDARYLGEKYFSEVYQYLPKGQCPPTE
jgi:hypothetical protein